jgi:hypothetical protein
MIALLLALGSDGRARAHLMFPVPWLVACLLSHLPPNPCVYHSILVEPRRLGTAHARQTLAFELAASCFAIRETLPVYTDCRLPPQSRPATRHHGTAVPYKPRSPSMVSRIRAQGKRMISAATSHPSFRFRSQAEARRHVLSGSAAGHQN